MTNVPVLLFYKKGCLDAGIEVYTSSEEAIKLLEDHIRTTGRETKQELENFLYKVKRDLDLTFDDFDWKE